MNLYWLLRHATQSQIQKQSYPKKFMSGLLGLKDRIAVFSLWVLQSSVRKLYDRNGPQLRLPGLDLMILVNDDRRKSRLIGLVHFFVRISRRGSLQATPCLGQINTLQFINAAQIAYPPFLGQIWFRIDSLLDLEKDGGLPFIEFPDLIKHLQLV